MAADHQRLILNHVAQAVEHPDHDYKAGRSFSVKSLTAVMYVGGEGVTSADGYPVDPGVPYNVNDSTDILYVCCDAADDGAEAAVAWLGV